MTKNSVSPRTPDFRARWTLCKNCDLSKNCASNERVLPRVFRSPSGSRVGHDPPIEDHPTILMVGESPGKIEALTGDPFIGGRGRAGHILGRAIETSIEETGYGGDYYWLVTNTVLCTPWTNASRYEIGKPTKEQMKACADHIHDLIVAYEPVLVIALGQYAVKSLKAEGIIHLHLPHPASFVESRGGGEDSMAFSKFTLDLSEALTAEAEEGE